MSQYVSLPHNKKLNLLRVHSLGCEWPDLDQEHWCLHCRKKFNGHSVRVWQDSKGALWLECGTAGCDGSPIDWAPYPWWDKKHRESSRRKEREPKRGRKRFDDDIPF
jgi:hypothetical protein